MPFWLLLVAPVPSPGCYSCFLRSGTDSVISPILSQAPKCSKDSSSHLGFALQLPDSRWARQTASDHSPNPISCPPPSARSSFAPGCFSHCNYDGQSWSLWLSHLFPRGTPSAATRPSRPSRPSCPSSRVAKRNAIVQSEASPNPSCHPNRCKFLSVYPLSRNFSPLSHESQSQTALDASLPHGGRGYPAGGIFWVAIGTSACPETPQTTPVRHLPT